MRVLSVLYRIESHSLDLFVNLFDSQIKPILLYGAEAWGVYSSRAFIEKVQLFAFKRFLGVDQRAPNNMVLGDKGRYPLEINCYIRASIYWLEIIRMNSNRLPRRAYNMLIKLDERDKNTWATEIRLLLYTHGFGFVWENQGVQSIVGFLKEFKQRLVDCNT